MRWLLSYLILLRTVVAVDHTISWHSGVYDPLLVNVGDTITFTFDSSHNVRKKPTQSCSGYSTTDRSSSSPFTYLVKEQDAGEKMWFACEPHCSNLNMNMEVTVGLGLNMNIEVMVPTPEPDCAYPLCPAPVTTFAPTTTSAPATTTAAATTSAPETTTAAATTSAPTTTAAATTSAPTTTAPTTTTAAPATTTAAPETTTAAPTTTAPTTTTAAATTAAPETTTAAATTSAPETTAPETTVPATTAPETLSTVIMFGPGVVSAEACIGDEIIIVWNGTHDLRETTRADCNSNETDNSPWLTEFKNTGYNQTLIGMGGRYQGETRYYKCSAHCGIDNARIEVTCKHEIDPSRRVTVNIDGSDLEIPAVIVAWLIVVAIAVALSVVFCQRKPNKSNKTKNLHLLSQKVEQLNERLLEKPLKWIP